MNIILVITSFLLIIYSVLLLYYRNGWKKGKVFRPTSSSAQVSISVIIPARNEAVTLPFLLAGLKAQDYPSELLTVIVVDDHSTDDTYNVALNFQGLNIKVIRLSDHVGTGVNSFKKKAIEVAITSSDSELIVTTDADCKVGPQWLSIISEFYRQQKVEMIIMPVKYAPTNSLLDIFQSLDFLALQGITGAAINNNFHGMCNGANLAYTRSAFKKVNGFEGIDHIASGDDMLLLHKINAAFPGKVQYLKSADVIVETAPVQGLREFISQRIRWASKGRSYKDGKIIAVMLIVYFLNLSLLVFPFIALFQQERMQLLFLWLMLVIIKTNMELIFLHSVARFFKQQSLLNWQLIAQPFHILYTVIAGFLGTAGTYTWKGRKVV